MRKLYTVFITVLFILVLGIGGVPSVYAQSDQGQEEFTLEEIMVTAEKRVEDVQKIASSITAISGDDITVGALDDMESVLKNMSSVVLNLTTPSGLGVYIRGIGTNVDTSKADPSVAVNMDGVYMGRAEIGFEAVYDVERVEVLRGPQGTLYGRNAIGGAVNLISRRPSDTFAAESNLRVGTYNLKHMDASLNVPLSEKFAARLAIMKEDRDSYFKPEGDSSDRFGTRLRLSYKPNDNLSFLFTAEYIDDRSLNRPQVPVDGSAGKMKIPPFMTITKPDLNNDAKGDDFLIVDPASGDLVAGPIGPDGWPVGDGIYDLLQTGWLRPTGGDEWSNDEWHADAPNNIYKFKIYSLEMVWATPITQITFLPAFNDNFRDYSIRGVMFGSSTENPWAYGGYPLTEGDPRVEETWTYELRFQNPESWNFKWLLGGYYMDTDEGPRSDPRDPTTYDDTEWHFANYFQPTKNKAYFGQATYPVTDRFRLTGGVRTSTDERKRSYRYGNSHLSPDHPLYPETNGTGRYDSGMQTYSDDATTTTYRAGIEFDFTEDSMMYAQLTTGFKAGGLNTTVPPVTFDPEELTSYSIGSKNRFLNNRLQINGEAYYYTYEGFQMQTMIAYVGITGDMLMDPMYVVNAETAKIKGMELEMDWLVTERDQLSFSGTYTDSAYGRAIFPPNPMVGTTAPVNLEGGQMANTPTWTFTLGWEHTWMTQDGDAISARAFTRMSDQYYATVETYIPGTLQKRYHMSELNMYYYPSGGKWSAGIWVKNLENNAITMRTMPIYRQFIGEPRTVGINFSIKY